MSTRTHLHTLRLKDYRCYTNTEVALHPHLCVFAGDNGSGKTAVVSAVAMLISRIFPHCNYQPQIRAIPYLSSNIRTWQELVKGKSRTRKAGVSRIHGEIFIPGNMPDRGQESSGLMGRLTAGSDTKGGSTTVRSTAIHYNKLVEQNESVPVFAYYGPHRGAAQGERKRFGRKKMDYSNPFSAYVNALDPSLDFQAFLNWFSEEDHAELIQQKKDSNYTSSELNAVREVLQRVFAESDRRFEDPRFEANPKRFVMTSKGANGTEMELEFDQLSDGYRGMIALVADFARRLAIANQYADINPLDGEGILIIDEVDAHLHPKWQYRVLSDLQRAFPNVQLIVTTHSAEVISSAPKECVYLLISKEERVEIIQPAEQTLGDSPEYIAGTIMNTPELYRATPAFQAYLECLAAIQQGATDSPEYAAAFQKVTEHYGESHHITLALKFRLEGMKRRLAITSRLHKL